MNGNNLFPHFILSFTGAQTDFFIFSNIPIFLFILVNQMSNVDVIGGFVQS